MFAGMVRKQLGLPFAGVTRNEGRFLLGEIHLKGLAVDVCLCDLLEEKFI